MELSASFSGLGSRKFYVTLSMAQHRGSGFYFLCPERVRLDLWGGQSVADPPTPQQHEAGLQPLRLVLPEGCAYSYGVARLRACSQNIQKKL